MGTPAGIPAVGPVHSSDLASSGNLYTFPNLYTYMCRNSGMLMDTNTCRTKP